MKVIGLLLPRIETVAVNDAPSRFWKALKELALSAVDLYFVTLVVRGKFKVPV